LSSYPITVTVDSATTSASGIVELATDAEAIALADTGRALTPSNLAAVLALDTQTFDASGTWTKPPQGRFLLIQGWGSAGGGARRSVGNGSGGGGGSYFDRLIPLSSLGATETVTIGSGGAIQATDNTNGNPGGTSSFGAHLIIYGGRGGEQAAAGTMVNGGGSASHFDAWAGGAINASGITGGVNVSTNPQSIGQSFYGASATGISAANAVNVIPIVAFAGGAGGAGHSSVGPSSGVQNTSLNGGSGGAGNGAGAGGNGSVPGGGGGSGTTQGGSGAHGRFIATVF
jgi:hypothetical protein